MPDVQIDQVDEPDQTHMPATVGTNEPADPAGAAHTHHLAVLRLAKAALGQALKTGAVLQDELHRRGDVDFYRWVDRELRLTQEEADFYFRFHEQFGHIGKVMSPAVETKLPQVIALLGKVPEAFGQCEGYGPTKNSSKLRRSKSNAVVTTKNRSTAKAAADSNPASQARDEQQKDLTAEQRQSLLGRSPKLFMQVTMGKLSPAEALRMAEDLPERSAPQPTA